MSHEHVSISRLRALMDAAVDAIILIDTAGGILDCNHAGERMFGYVLADIQGKNVSLLMPQPYRREHDDYMMHYLATNEARIIGIGREVTAQRANGEHFPIELAVGEVRDDGRIIGFAGFIRDLTERRAVEARLRAREAELQESRERLIHASRLGTLGEMAAGIAHEVNQPLTAIATYARACNRLLQQPGDTQELLVDTLRKIAEQAERAGDVIQGLRAFTRKQSLPKQTLDLRRLLLELEPLLDIERRSSHIAIEMQLSPGPAWVRADAVQLQQVVLNLVRNAVDAMRDGGGEKIILRLEARGEQWWQLDVEDRGPGIPGEILDELFHPFVTTKPDGVGLGLSICNTIVESHGGELTCASGEPGKTIFRMLLPAMDTEKLVE